MPKKRNGQNQDVHHERSRHLWDIKRKETDKYGVIFGKKRIFIGSANERNGQNQDGRNKETDIYRIYLKKKRIFMGSMSGKKRTFIG